MATTLQIKRRASGATGAPSTLKTAELAYNMVDGVLYVGYGDDGSGNATTVRQFAKDDFTLAQRVPSGGTSGQILTVDGSGNVVWGAAPQNGTTYTAGTGITITGASIAADTSVLATQTNLTNGLATKANVSHTHAAADTTSGTFDVARIPDLAATKITSGTFDVARIPDHDASKITSGTFVAARIPTLDASKVATGVFDVARIPVLPSQVVQVASGDLSTLTTTQQNAIAQGTVVTTSDGNRYVYNTGSKTLAASYVQLADITPEWSSIANKPVFATVATSGSYADLSGRPTLATVATTGSYADLSNKPSLATVATSGSYTDLLNRPTLGTMASQNANAVAITGGTINGVTMDGGTF